MVTGRPAVRKVKAAVKAAVKVGISLSLLTLLSACGGGGGSSSGGSAVPPPVPGSRSPTAITVPAPTQPSADLLAYSMGTEDSGLASVSIEVPANGLSLLVSGRAMDPLEEVRIDRVTDPDGRIIYEIDSLINNTVRGDLLRQVQRSTGETTVVIPASTAEPLKSGTYMIDIATDDNDGFAGFNALVKTGSLASQVNVDINLVVAMGNNQLATAFPNATITRTNLEAMLGADIDLAMGTLLSTQGVGIGAVNYFVADDALVADLELAEQNQNFDDPATSNDQAVGLCNLVGPLVGAPTRAVTVVWLPRLGTSRSVGGIAPGAPGNPLLAEALQSCVVASFAAYAGDLDAHSLNIVHQVGHFAGLLHPTEENGEVFDVLSDTPQCPLAQFDGQDDAANNLPGTVDGMISDSECGVAGGADNIMFFSSRAIYGPFNFTFEQGDILRRSSLIYP